MSIQPLFEPFSLKSLQLDNRIVMAPMTRSFSPDGVPGEQVAQYYARRAKGGVGLILTEGTVINRPASSNQKDIPHFYGEKALQGWANVVEQVHAQGGVIAPQLWHQGIVKPHDNGWLPSTPFEGPSGYVTPDKIGGVAMSEEDILNTVEAFAQAARDARRLGFRALELHGAHGYLIDQFFWHRTNLRTDRYGGSTIQERNRFALEVIEAVRAAVGEDFPIILRLSQWKATDYQARVAETPEEMEQWLLPLAEAGVDLFHCSQRRFWEPEFAGSELNFAGWAKKLTGKPTISVGSVGLSQEFIAGYGEGPISPASLDELLKRLERGEFDLVAVGRALISDPDWVRKVQAGEMENLTGFDKNHLQTLL